MMLPTHALGGMVLALPLFAVAPEYASVALVAGLVGGIFPDLDLYVGHRKTLHYPVYYSAFAVVAAVIALFVPTIATVSVTVFLLGAAVHCLSDILGSGLELRPWEGTSERAVYDHYRDTWIAPRQLITYDGSPADLCLSGVLAIPLLYALDGFFQWIVIGAIAVAVVYTALRRLLADLAAVVFGVLPKTVRPYVPERYLEDLEAPPT
ncbi:metal-dependent hydrolase [Natronolimnobius sp. AArcel1]|uniref:metal-dependent hydrolase n=1 Tax=Natronolimnobius sp. AArcel1 TaxID=1679093 RepID=UPI0013EC859F|nr:metal-dependent hydrolase [Natronolimnobius sp. AArcel1]NGM70544.1 metal-dependent hydrolase [Natronolimnobius sp. AArcel1]